MTDNEQRLAARDFAKRWKGKGCEKGESQPFWMELLEKVYGVENSSEFIKFEQQAHIDYTGFIDGMIKPTKVMIERKGLDKGLDKPICQSDGAMLTPVEQAMR